MRWLIGVATIGSLLLPGADTAFAPNCSAFAPEFAPLAAQLGPILGEPTGCADAARAGGDITQPTSTGFAYLRAGGGAPMFTTGHEFWALLPGGMEHWTGSPHMGFDPPGAAPPEAGPATPALPDPGAYPQVEAVMALGGPDPSDGALLVQRGEATYRMVEDAACRHTAVAAGQALFLRPADSSGGAGAELVLLGLGACPIVEAAPR